MTIRPWQQIAEEASSGNDWRHLQQLNEELEEAIKACARRLRRQIHDSDRKEDNVADPTSTQLP